MHLEYLIVVAAQRYYIGDGFANRNGGIIAFKAQDINNAKVIADNDPLIKRNLNTYELNEWNLVILTVEC